MRRLSAFIIAAVLAGALEVATAKSEHSTTNSNAVITNHAIAIQDTVPTKKKKKTDPTQPTPTPTPTPSPNPNPPAPNPVAIGDRLQRPL